MLTATMNRTNATMISVVPRPIHRPMTELGARENHLSATALFSRRESNSSTFVPNSRSSLGSM